MTKKWCVTRGLSASNVPMAAYALDGNDHPQEMAGLVGALRQWYERTRAEKASRIAAERTRRKLLEDVAVCLGTTECHAG